MCPWVLCAKLSSLNLFVRQVPQPGTLKLSHLKEGAYVFQLTVTDSVGQRSSDNVSVTVLPRLRSPGGEEKVLPSSPPWPAQPSWSWKDGAGGFTCWGHISVFFSVLEVLAKNVIANMGSMFKTIWALLV